jgi:hypothetical protein
MFTEGLAIVTEQLCLWSLQRPRELRAVSFAGVNLVALGMNLEENALPCRWMELLRDLLRGDG